MNRHIRKTLTSLPRYSLEIVATADWLASFQHVGGSKELMARRKELMARRKELMTVWQEIKTGRRSQEITPRNREGGTKVFRLGKKIQSNELNGLKALECRRWRSMSLIMEAFTSPVSTH